MKVLLESFVYPSMNLTSDCASGMPPNVRLTDPLFPTRTQRYIASRGSFSFGNADTLVNWATSNGKLIRGHTFGKELGTRKIPSDIYF